MERQNFCQKLYGIKQKAFRATFVNRWSGWCRGQKVLNVLFCHSNYEIAPVVA